MKQQFYREQRSFQSIKAQQVPNIAGVDDNPTVSQEYKQQASAVTS